MGCIVEMYWMTAEVTKYQRKNGNRDTGFCHRPLTFLDYLICLMKSSMQAKEYFTLKSK